MNLSSDTFHDWLITVTAPVKILKIMNFWLILLSHQVLVNKARKVSIRCQILINHSTLLNFHEKWDMKSGILRLNCDSVQSTVNPILCQLLFSPGTATLKRFDSYIREMRVKWEFLRTRMTSCYNRDQWLVNRC